jgi:hypothetical protein
MTLVNVAHIFQMYDGHDLAQLTLVDHSLDGSPEVGEAQHMADNNLYALFLSGFGNVLAFLGGNSHGLFQQEIVAFFDQGKGRLLVHVVLGGDDGKIRHFGLGGQILPVCKDPVIGKIVQLLGSGTLGLGSIGYSNDLKLIGIIYSIAGVGGAALTVTDDHGSDFFHEKFLLYGLTIFAIFIIIRPTK